MMNRRQKMIAEPHKIKTVRRINLNTTWDERSLALKAAGYNTFRIPSDAVAFDMTSQGTSAMSQEQQSGGLLGDEAYAGSINFDHLQSAVKRILGHECVCPTHNLKGSLKLLSTTMIEPGQVILANSLIPLDLAIERGAKVLNIRNPSNKFSGNLDMAMLAEGLATYDVAYIFVEAFADGVHPVSLAHLQALRRIADVTGVPVVLDASRVVENALFEKREHESWTVRDLVNSLACTADVCIMDAGQDARCNVGGLICTSHAQLHEKYQNEVVLYEGLHTYGGMSGRTMEIFARGLVEMVQESQAMWIANQVDFFTELLAQDVPLIHRCDGVYLKADEFIPHIKAHPAQALAAALYLHAGIRTVLDGRYREDESLLPVQIPRLCLSNLQLAQIAKAIEELHVSIPGTVAELHLNGITLPEWHDEAVFTCSEEPLHSRHRFECEPYTIRTFEHVGVATREKRERAIRDAGYNTFLLMSKDVTIDLLTDSGTSAMSVEQWQAYEGGVETPATSASYQDFVKTVREVTGYKHVIPTHQGRAAEHIMSNVLIQEGGVVPGNMYFTTTLLHQRLAGGRFVDVIVDEAHDPTSTFKWKGNIDLTKLFKIIEEYGADNVPYVSFEMSVNMAGGQPFSMINAREVSAFCHEHGILVMFDSTRAAENAYMIQKNDPKYKDTPIKDILKEMFSYGDGCTVSSKKDCLVNIGGYLAYKDREDLYESSMDMLRKYEGSATNGGMSAGDMAAHAQGMREMVEDDHLRSRVQQTQYLGDKLLQAGIPILEPPGTHAIFLDAKRFLPHLDQEDGLPAQALAAALFVETGVRAMERGIVSKGRAPSGENQRPALELVRLTIPRRVYTRSHMDLVAEGIIDLYKTRDSIKGLRFVYEPKHLRFFQSRFEKLD